MLRRAGVWAAAVVLVALAPFPVAAGKRMLDGQGATPSTAAAVTVAVAATIFCLVSSATAVFLAFRPEAVPAPPPSRPSSRSARHTARRASLGSRLADATRRPGTSARRRVPAAPVVADRGRRQ